MTPQEFFKPGRRYALAYADTDRARLGIRTVDTVDPHGNIKMAEGAIIVPGLIYTRSEVVDGCVLRLFKGDTVALVYVAL